MRPSVGADGQLEVSNFRLPNYQIFNFMNGVLVIDKPAGMTSHDVVNRVRRILGVRSVGHLGTLDPSATGVLPILVGSFTRLAQFYLHSEKRYEGVIRFGFATSTYDADGDATNAPQDVTLDVERVRAIAGEFRGILQQTPPPFSAKKVAGVPAYKLARKRVEVALRPVQVEVKEFAILDVAGGRVTFRAWVGSGTYMRSIAHEMGVKLGCGAHLAELRRTAVAEFVIEEACTLQELESIAGESLAKKRAERWSLEAQGSAEHVFVHPRQLLPRIPCVTTTDESAAIIRTGRAVNLPEMSQAPLVKVFLGQRQLIAIGERIAGTLFHPKIVFAT
ncbi:MAG TPA: tRNA pseudouridine(55) synthase TruB [Terriglobales bacterium]|nr:tRNA pseudouridine(55) synthase TruB [Terriglobales bacterium]